MRARILKITDLKGDEKDKRIWGETRGLNFLEIGAPMTLYYLDDPNKARITSLVVGIQDNFFKNVQAVYTENSIYYLDFLEEGEE